MPDPLSPAVPAGAAQALVRLGAAPPVVLSSPSQYLRTDGVALVGRFVADRPFRLVRAVFAGSGETPVSGITSTWTAGLRYLAPSGPPVELGSASLDYASLDPSKPVPLTLADVEVPAGAVVEAVVTGTGQPLNAPGFTLTPVS